MKAMISQPMRGKTDEEIAETREKAVKELEERGYEIVNNVFPDEWQSDETLKAYGVVHIPLYFLAKSLNSMSECDAVYFCEGWENARGCRIEHEAAAAYGLALIEERNCFTVPNDAEFHCEAKCEAKERAADPE